MLWVYCFIFLIMALTRGCLLELLWYGSMHFSHAVVGECKLQRAPRSLLEAPQQLFVGSSDTPLLLRSFQSRFHTKGIGKAARSQTLWPADVCLCHHGCLLQSRFTWVSHSPSPPPALQTLHCSQDFCLLHFCLYTPKRVLLQPGTLICVWCLAFCAKIGARNELIAFSNGNPALL